MPEDEWAGEECANYNLARRNANLNIDRQWTILGDYIDGNWDCKYEGQEGVEQLREIIVSWEHVGTGASWHSVPTVLAKTNKAI